MNYMSDKPVVADPWQGFSDGEWRNKVDTRGFIQKTTLHMMVTTASSQAQLTVPNSSGLNWANC